MRKVLMALVVAFAWSAMPAQAQEAEIQLPEREADLVLAVEGFDCAMCAAELEKRLRKIETTEAVDPQKWEEGVIAVWVKEGADIEDEALSELVKEAGFVLKKVQRAKSKAEAEPTP